MGWFLASKNFGLNCDAGFLGDFSQELSHLSIKVYKNRANVSLTCIIEEVFFIVKI